MTLISALFAALSYGLATLLLWQTPAAARERWPAAVALLLHTGVLVQLLWLPAGLSIGWTGALALFAWLPMAGMASAGLMAAGSPGAAALLAALSAASVLLGAAVERWLFFAQARHLVTSYY